MDLTKGSKKPFKSGLWHIAEVKLETGTGTVDVRSETQRSQYRTKQPKDDPPKNQKTERRNIKELAWIIGDKVQNPLQHHTKNTSEEHEARCNKQSEQENVAGCSRPCKAFEQQRRPSSVHVPGTSSVASVPDQRSTDSRLTAPWTRDVGPKRMRECAPSPVDKEVSLEEFVDVAFKNVAVKAHKLLSFEGKMRKLLQNKAFQNCGPPRGETKNAAPSATHHYPKHDKQISKTSASHCGRARKASTDLTPEKRIRYVLQPKDKT